MSKNFNNLLKNGLHIKRIKEKSFISCHTFLTRKQVASRKSVRLSRDTFSPDNGQMRFLSSGLRKPFQTFTVKLTTRERMKERMAEEKKTRSIKSHFSCSPKAEMNVGNCNLKFEVPFLTIWDEYKSNLIPFQLNSQAVVQVKTDDTEWEIGGEKKNWKLKFSYLQFRFHLITFHETFFVQQALLFKVGKQNEGQCMCVCMSACDLNI